MLIGIDFGTSNTCICYYSEKKKTTEFITDELGNVLIPSCVYLSQQETFCGTIALDKGGIRFFKNDLNYKYCIPFFNYIKNLIKTITTNECNEEEILYCVISIPVDWDFKKCELLKSYFIETGFVVTNILLEPVAASLVDNQKQSKNESENYIMVVDCGGGTTDLSLISIDSELDYYQVLNVLGDSYLGGEELTKSIIEFFNLQNLKNKKEVYSACQMAKETLTSQYDTILYLESQDKQLRLSRHQFEYINSNWCERFFKLLTKFYEQIHEYQSHISKIILIGGSSKCYLVKQICKKVFPEINVILESGINPQTAVSRGCLTKCRSNVDCYEKTDDITIMNVVPDTIGVEVDGGIFVPIISKNNLLPVTRTMLFTNSTNDSSIDIHIYKGDRKYVHDNTYITSVILTGIPESKRGLLRINITFSIDQNLITSVLAKTDTGQILNHTMTVFHKKKNIEKENEYNIFLKKLKDLNE